MTETEHWMEEVERLGGRFELRGDQVKVEYPHEVADVIESILEKLSPRKEELRQLLYKHPPGLSGPTECPPLPSGIRLLRYAPKTPPVVVQPCSIVTDVEKFIRAYLRDLEWRPKHPQGHAAPPLYEILQKLAEVGVELELTDVATVERSSSEGR